MGCKKHDEEGTTNINSKKHEATDSMCT